MRSDLHDKVLMARIAEGDEVALRELIEKHQGIVYGTIAKMLDDPAEANDLAQQVFIRIYKAAPAYQPKARFRTWMFTIVQNLVFNEHRRRRRATIVSLNQEPDETGIKAEMDLPDTKNLPPDEGALQKEMLQQVDRAILALPYQQRLAVVLRRYDEFSYEEIAAILKTSVPSTKSLLFRARETLRTVLKDYLDC